MSGRRDDHEDQDERLRRALHAAHEGEAAPPFAALVDKRPRRRRTMLLAPLAVAGALAAVLLLWPRPAPTPPRIELSSLQLSSRGPLDFLLHMPDDKLLTQTPRFDGKGDWP